MVLFQVVSVHPVLVRPASRLLTVSRAWLGMEKKRRPDTRVLLERPHIPVRDISNPLWTVEIGGNRGESSDG